MNTVDFHGQHQLIDAINAVSAEQGPDLAVVRGFITDPDLLGVIARDRGTESDKSVRSALYEGAPVLHAADALVADRWTEIGYEGMAVTRGLRLDQVRAGGIEPHLDDSIYGDRSVEAVAQLSLCLSGHRWLSGQRLPVAFRNADGTFDVSRYEAYTAYDGELYTSIRNGREPRSRVLVHAGDLALFGHHPLVTLHAVTHDGNEESVARLLTWRAVKQG